MSGKCASRTFPPPNNLPLDVNITASEKQNKSCLDFQANLPSFNATLVVHKSTKIRISKRQQRSFFCRILISELILST
jgi:hypothetical protein